MGDRAALEAYSTLVAWLRSNHLDWVADQIEDEVALGKVKSERIQVGQFEAQSRAPELPLSTTKEIQTPVERKTSRSGSEFLARAEYTEQEQFDIALGAIEAVVLGAVKIQDSLLSALGPTASIHFVPGETGEIAHSFQSSDLNTQRVKIDELSKHLELLREDVRNAD